MAPFWHLTLLWSHQRLHSFWFERKHNQDLCSDLQRQLSQGFHPGRCWRLSPSRHETQNIVIIIHKVLAPQKDYICFNNNGMRHFKIRLFSCLAVHAVVQMDMKNHRRKRNLTLHERNKQHSLEPHPTTKLTNLKDTKRPVVICKYLTECDGIGNHSDCQAVRGNLHFEQSTHNEETCHWHVMAEEKLDLNVLI